MLKRKMYFGYRPGDQVFVFNWKTKHWVQGVVKDYIPLYKRNREVPGEPAYLVSTKRLRLNRKTDDEHKMVKDKDIIAVNGFIKEMDLEPLFNVGQEVNVRKNGQNQRAIIIQMLDRQSSRSGTPVYLVYNSSEKRKHTIGEAKLSLIREKRS